MNAIDWNSTTTQDLIATVQNRSPRDAQDAEDRAVIEQAAATLNARCGEGTAERYGYRP